MIGSIKDWSVERKIQAGFASMPTLIVSGRYDEASPEVQEHIKAQIPHAEQRIFEESSHLPHVEERGEYMRVVGEWMKRVEEGSK